MFAAQKFLPYIEFQHCTFFTDHSGLQNLMTIEEPTGSWAMRLMGLDMTIKYQKGTLNVISDALSRAPCGQPYELQRTYVDSILPVADPPQEKLLQFAAFPDP